MKWTADFETTTDVNDCRVWAWGVFQIGKDKFLYGNTIESFFEWCEKTKNVTLYFHNLKFDGEFILHYIMTNNYTHVKEKKLVNNGTFKTLISDKGMFYCMEILTFNGCHIKIYDSLKIIPFTVEKVAKAFGLPISKLEIDYTEYREPGHVLTEKEVSYLRNDVEIMARALNTLFSQKLTKMTQGSNALADYKRIIGKKIFEKWYPVPYYDEDIRRAYKGGYTYLNPKFKNQMIGEGIVLDVNSLYPSRMYYDVLPYGEGVAFTGKYQNDTEYPLFVQCLNCTFELKEGYLPTIQLKNNLAFCPTEYVTSSNGEDVTLTLTSVDLKLFFEHYQVQVNEWGGGWKFRGASGMFKDYIDKWYKIKAEATISGNDGMRTLSKLMQNALYGKFALNPNVCSKIPYLMDGVVHYRNDEPETREPIYIPMGAFITAYARNTTIRAAQNVFDRFIYADTDSLHLVGTELPEGLDIHDTRLGAWAHEKTFTRAKFIRAKTYVEEVDGELQVTCAGLPHKLHEEVTFDNFFVGQKYFGKLRNVHTQGGIVLEETEFTIRE